MKNFKEFLVEKDITGIYTSQGMGSPVVLPASHEKLIPGGSLASSEMFALMTPEDFWKYEERHGRIQKLPKNLSESIENDPIGAAMIPFDTHKNYSGLGTVLQHLKNLANAFEFQVKDEADQVDEKLVDFAVDRINDLMLSEKGLCGHYKGFLMYEKKFLELSSEDDAIADAKLKRSRRQKEFLELDEMCKKKIKYTSKMFFDKKNMKLRLDAINQMKERFDRLYNLYSTTFSEVDKKVLLHQKLIFDEGKYLGDDKVKEILQSGKEGISDIMRNLRYRNGNRLSQKDMENVLRAYLNNFAEELKSIKEFDKKSDFIFNYLATSETDTISKVFFKGKQKAKPTDLHFILAGMKSWKNDFLLGVFGDLSKAELEAKKLMIGKLKDKAITEAHKMATGEFKVFIYDNGKFKPPSKDMFRKSVNAMSKDFDVFISDDDEVKSKKKFQIFDTAAASSTKANAKMQSTSKDTNTQISQNTKISKFQYAKNFTIPAWRGLIYMERAWVDVYGNHHPKGTLAIVNTCPSAHVCKSYCYGADGQYIVQKAPMLNASRNLSLIINHPKKFESIMVSLLEKSVNAIYKNVKRRIADEDDPMTSESAWELIFRWHDTGDFFTKKYYMLVMNIARQTSKLIFNKVDTDSKKGKELGIKPKYTSVLHYAYTKQANLIDEITRSDDISVKIPDNFVMNISQGSIHDKTLFDKLVNMGFKSSIVVPTKFKKSRLSRKTLNLIDKIWVDGADDKFQERFIDLYKKYMVKAKKRFTSFERSNLVAEEEGFIHFKFPPKPFFELLSTLNLDKDLIMSRFIDAYISCIVDCYDYTRDEILTYDEMLKTSMDDKSQYFCLVYGDDGDTAAIKAGVRGSLLVIH